MEKKNSEPVMRQVNVESLFGALYSKGEAKLSDHIHKEGEEPVRQQK